MIAAPHPEKPSLEILDHQIWRDFLDDPRNPALVSFPRTGSHWLRMLMELQFERPTLIRIFFYFDSREFLCWHTHDDDLSFERDRVIYLHRDPVDTVYSQLRYLGADVFVPENVVACCDQYLAHLRKWLVGRGARQEKLVLTYQDLESDPGAALKSVADFLGLPWNPSRCREVVEIVSKELVRNKTKRDDARVINSLANYKDGRSQFRGQFEETIRQHFLSREPSLASVFAESYQPRLP
jgi:hypothetical protein